MEKIPTAEEFLESQHETVPNIEFDIRQVMIEFARMHVEAALKEASEKAGLNMIPTTTFGKNYRKEILESYSLDNIK